MTTRRRSEVGILFSALFAATAYGLAADAPAKPAICLVDAKRIEPPKAGVVTPPTESLSVMINDVPHALCSRSCRDRFAGWPEKYLGGERPACTVQPNFKGFFQLSRRVEINNRLYYLCCEPCVGWLRDKPWLYLKELPDPVTGAVFKLTEQALRSDVGGQLYFFASPEQKAAFDREPMRYAIRFRR